MIDNLRSSHSIFLDLLYSASFHLLTLFPVFRCPYSIHISTACYLFVNINRLYHRIDSINLTERVLPAKFEYRPNDAPNCRQRLNGRGYSDAIIEPGSIIVRFQAVRCAVPIRSRTRYSDNKGINFKLLDRDDAPWNSADWLAARNPPATITKLSLLFLWGRNYSHRNRRSTRRTGIPRWNPWVWLKKLHTKLNYSRTQKRGSLRKQELETTS